MSPKSTTPRSERTWLRCDEEIILTLRYSGLSTHARLTYYALALAALHEHSKPPPTSGQATFSELRLLVGCSQARLRSALDELIQHHFLTTQKEGRFTLSPIFPVISVSRLRGEYGREEPERPLLLEVH